MSHNVIYTRKNFKIYKMGNNKFIVHNTNKRFKNGHTHINNFNTAKYVISMCIGEIIPYHTSNYIIDSLMRLSSSKKYIELLEKNKTSRD